MLFINDSKATNADSAAKALASFDGIYWIAGGKPKEGGITSLAEFFPRIRKAYLIGESAQDFATTLAGRVPNEVVGTLDAAVAAAARDAAASGKPGVVLLSPACASFDQFPNFEVRGERFRRIGASRCSSDPSSPRKRGPIFQCGGYRPPLSRGRRQQNSRARLR